MDVHEHISGHQHLVSLFGYWPDFHDATVEWLRLDRQDSVLGPGPTFEVMIHAFQMTDETDAAGYIVLRNHVLVHLRFSYVFDFRCNSFYHNYDLMDVSITGLPGDARNSKLFQIDLNSIYGEEGIFFKCSRMEVVSVTRCDQAGKPLVD